MRVLRIGIASIEQVKQRHFDIVAGKYKRQQSDPKLWFTTLGQIRFIFNPRHLELLKILHENCPVSFAELKKLARMTDSHLSRALTSFRKIDLITIEKNKEMLIKEILYDVFEITIVL